MPLILADGHLVSMVNARVFSFRLTSDEVSVLDGLHGGFRSTRHPTATP